MKKLAMTGMAVLLMGSVAQATLVGAQYNLSVGMDMNGHEGDFPADFSDCYAYFGGALVEDGSLRQQADVAGYAWVVYKFTAPAGETVSDVTLDTVTYVSDGDVDIFWTTNSYDGSVPPEGWTDTGFHHPDWGKWVHTADRGTTMEFAPNANGFFIAYRIDNPSAGETYQAQLSGDSIVASIMDHEQPFAETTVTNGGTYGRIWGGSGDFPGYSPTNNTYAYFGDIEVDSSGALTVPQGTSDGPSWAVYKLTAGVGNVITNLETYIRYYNATHFGTPSPDGGLIKAYYTTSNYDGLTIPGASPWHSLPGENGTWGGPYEQNNTVSNLYAKDIYIAYELYNPTTNKVVEIQIDQQTVAVAAVPHAPSTILGFSHVASNVFEMVVDSPTPWDSYPKTTTDLVHGSWGDVGYSTNSSGPFATNNLGVVSGTNTIYLEANEPAAFFGIGEK